MFLSLLLPLKMENEGTMEVQFSSNSNGCSKHYFTSTCVDANEGTKLMIFLKLRT